MRPIERPDGDHDYAFVGDTGLSSVRTDRYSDGTGIARRPGNRRVPRWRSAGGCRHAERQRRCSSDHPHFGDGSAFPARGLWRQHRLLLEPVRGDALYRHRGCRIRLRRGGELWLRDQSRLCAGGRLQWRRQGRPGGRHLFRRERSARQRRRHLPKRQKRLRRSCYRACSGRF